MKKIIAYNLLAACGCFGLMLLITIFHIHIHSVGKWGAFLFAAVTYALVFAANHEILEDKSKLMRYISIALISAPLAMLWFMLSWSSVRLIGSIVGGH